MSGVAARQHLLGLAPSESHVIQIRWHGSQLEIGTATMFAMALRGSAREVILVNRNRDRARGAVADLQYGAGLAAPITLRAGDYDDLRGAVMVVITVGANEKTGGATNRSDPAGRLRLLH